MYGDGMHCHWACHSPPLPSHQDFQQPVSKGGRQYEGVVDVVIEPERAAVSTYIPIGSTLQALPFCCPSTCPGFLGPRKNYVGVLGTTYIHTSYVDGLHTASAGTCK